MIIDIYIYIYIYIYIIINAVNALNFLLNLDNKFFNWNNLSV